jgi:hypothetical protein
MFCIGGDDVYQVTGEDRARGGGGWGNADPDAEPVDEDDDDDDAKPMDEEEDNDGSMMKEVPFEEIEQLVFPEPVRTLLTYDPARAGLWFHFERQRIPHALQTLAPNVFKAMASYEEGAELLNNAILVQPALPMPVHASPLISLFENQHLPGEAPHDMLTRPPTWKRKYISWAKSARQLHELKTLALENVLPLHESITPQIRADMYKEFCRQLGLMETAQNRDLDTLYGNAAGASVSHTAVMERFLALMERYSLSYIWLLEYFLHSLLVAPYGPSITLDTVLTPNITPSLADCEQGGVAADVVRDMRVFFRAKYDMCAAQPDAADISRFKPRMELLYDATAPAPGSGETWRGWLPREVLIDYIRWTDCDAKLQ